MRLTQGCRIRRLANGITARVLDWDADDARVEFEPGQVAAGRASIRLVAIFTMWERAPEPTPFGAPTTGAA